MFDTSILWYIGAFILILSPIIFVHELGHFWVARRFGIQVDEFGIGFPPRAVKLFERNGTVYSLNWIPLGGFVRPAGEDDPTIPGGLAAASKTARFCVLVAGATANFIFAFFIFFVALSVGEAVTRVSIDSLLETNAVAETGIEAGDIFVSVNGEEIGTDRNLLIQQVSSNPNVPIDIVVERDGQELSFTVTPMARDGNPDAGVLGVMLGRVPTGERTSLGPVEAARESLSLIQEVIVQTVQVPAQLIRGSLNPEEARLISVVGISQIAGAEAQVATQTGDWFGVMMFAGLINVGLGFANLLPIPALDGGRILFVLIEAIRGRRIEPEREGMIHVVGMLLLLMLMAIMIVNDIINPILG